MAPSEANLRHKQLLDLEELISEASCPSVSSSSKSGASTARPPRRPSSAASEGSRSRRPSSASCRSRPPSSAASTASGHSSGAASARSAASACSAASSAHSTASSGQGPASHHGAAEGSKKDCTKDTEARSKEGEARSKEFEALCDLVGSKAAQRFRTIRQCFRYLDRDHNGFVARSEIHEFFRHLNLNREFADRFFDFLDLNRSGGIDYLEVASIVGPHIQPAYQAPVLRSALSREEHLDIEELRHEHELVQMGEVIGTKASQKFRNVTDCFRSLDADKDGRITREDCRRFIENLGFKASQGDRIFDLLRGQHHEVDFHRLVDTLGPYIQPGYIQLGRAASPSPSRVVVDRQAPNVRQRPQSARQACRGGRSRPAADIRAAAAWHAKASHGSSAGSLASASTASGTQYSSSEALEAATFRPEEAGLADPDKRYRAEVNAGPFGSFMYLPETPRAVNNLTWDSTQVKKRLGVYPSSDAGAPASRTAAPRPPSARRQARQARWPLPREAEASGAASAKQQPHQTGAKSGTPDHAPARGRDHQGHTGAVTHRPPSAAASTSSLASALEQRWSVL